MSLPWHSLIATVKIQDFLQIEDFKTLAFWLSYSVLNVSSAINQMNTILESIHVKFWVFSLLALINCVKNLYIYIYGPFYGIGFSCFNVKNCWGYILPTPVLKSFEYDFPYLLFQTCTKVLCSDKNFSQSVIEVRLEGEFPARHEKFLHAKKC